MSQSKEIFRTFPRRVSFNLYYQCFSGTMTLTDKNGEVLPSALWKVILGWFCKDVLEKAWTLENNSIFKHKHKEDICRSCIFFTLTRNKVGCFKAVNIWYDAKGKVKKWYLFNKSGWHCIEIWCNYQEFDCNDSEYSIAHFLLNLWPNYPCSQNCYHILETMGSNMLDTFM